MRVKATTLFLKTAPEFSQNGHPNSLIVNSLPSWEKEQLVIHSSAVCLQSTFMTKECEQEA